MDFNIGDLVTRNSHNNDVLFKIISFDSDIAVLKGVDLRLYADSLISDLKKANNDKKNSDKVIVEENIRDIVMDRSKYFYLPGSILHVDGDKDYLDRCMNFYKEMNVKANGITIPEDVMEEKVTELLNEYKPDILVITGHDAYYKKRKVDTTEYQNSFNFVETVKKADRKSVV